jgi:uncharacterized membrane protein YvbJ
VRLQERNDQLRKELAQINEKREEKITKKLIFGGISIAFLMVTVVIVAKKLAE